MCLPRLAMQHYDIRKCMCNMLSWVLHWILFSEISCGSFSVFQVVSIKNEQIELVLIKKKKTENSFSYSVSLFRCFRYNCIYVEPVI